MEVNDDEWRVECPNVQGRSFSERTVKLIQRTYHQFQYDESLRHRFKIQTISKEKETVVPMKRTYRDLPGATNNSIVKRGIQEENELKIEDLNISCSSESSENSRVRRDELEEIQSLVVSHREQVQELLHTD